MLKRTTRKSVPKPYEFKTFTKDKNIIDISSSDDEDEKKKMLNEGHSTNKQAFGTSTRLYDDEEEPSIEEYYDDKERSYEVNKKIKVEDSDPDYVPSENAHTTTEVNVSFAAKIKDDEEVDKMFTEAMGILAAIWKFRQEKKKVEMSLRKINIKSMK
ncbi:uncharacterized protein A4U43_C10F8130 [Asparagus officinalis]|uniref:Uncharacterized protein n=1 Tax=Asparagus officinalis TaxID=4686 RepID=A0A5P1E1N6_ASPOF|nr:uncharacterized protein A4U43_C10F8130 [Asparagus officinalis]